MPKMTLDRDEIYPVYYIRDEVWYTGQRTVEISPELRRRYKRVMESFFDLQERLAWIYKENESDE